MIPGIGVNGGILSAMNEGKFVVWGNREHYVSTNFGYPYVQKSVLGNVRGVTSSRNGKYVTIVTALSQWGDLPDIYTSSDYCNTISGKNLTAADIVDVAMSGDGKYQYALRSDGFYKSIDYGATWTLYNTVSNAISITCDYSGAYVSIISSYMIFRSTNYGVSFTTSTPYSSMTSVAMSGDGKYRIITQSGYNKAYLSSDYGATWTEKLSGYSFIKSALSGDGKYIMVSHTGRKSYLSSDYGATWKSIDYGGTSICISKTGMYIACNASPAYPYNHAFISSDYGTTFNDIYTGLYDNFITLSRG